MNKPARTCAQICIQKHRDKCTPTLSLLSVLLRVLQGAADSSGSVFQSPGLCRQ